MKCTIACIVFSSDKSAESIVNKYIENSDTFQIVDTYDESIPFIFKKYNYIAVVHEGDRVSSEFVVELTNLATTNDVNLGFIVHPFLSKLDLSKLTVFSGNPHRHAILNHVESANRQVNQQDFWYGSGKHASIREFNDWVNDGGKPSVISILSHSREDLIYTVDGIICGNSEFARPELTGNLPSCYMTGRCYRDDVERHKVANLSADLIVLDGCANFKIGSDTFNPETTLLGSLLSSEVKHIIGSPIIKTGYIEEVMFIHKHLNNRPLGEIVRILNQHYTNSYAGLPPFALWGDPRTVIPVKYSTDTVSTGFIGNAADATMPRVHDIREDVEKIHASFKEIQKYKSWQVLGMSIASVSGQISQLETLIQGASKSLSQSYFIQGGNEHKKMQNRLQKIPGIIKKIEKQLIDYLVDKTYGSGFNLTDCYREGFIVAAVQPTVCPTCKNKGYLYRMESPLGITRLVVFCPTCGTPMDLPEGYSIRKPYTVKIKDNVITIEEMSYHGEIGACIVSGSKFKFDHFKSTREEGHNKLTLIVGNISPHLYQLKVFYVVSGDVAVFQEILYVTKNRTINLVNVK